MALNQFMHPRNRYKNNKPDFARLAEKYPEFAAHVSVNLTGSTSLDFKDPESLRALTCTLLKEDFGLDIELPLDRLIPTVPLRLNYIHWVEDLLQECGYTTDIYGIDIGCGAACIYPLLGCRINSWHYAASEVDELSLQYACNNVKRNNLQDNITVLASTSDTLIRAIVKDAPQPLYHFTMCNPPFFGNMLEAQGIMSRTMCRPDPKSISTASEVEMIYEGGEVDFVTRMICESLQLREQVVWYTSMVGKKSSLTPLKEELRKHKIRNFTTAEFCQGRTMRWGIAWTFHDDIRVPPPSKRRKEKQRPPLVIPVPGHFVDKAVQAMRSSTSPSASSAKGNMEKICAVAQAIKHILQNDLQISYVIRPSSRKIIKLECTAHKNTWANERRRRRHKKRLKLEQPVTSNKDLGFHGDILPLENVKNNIGPEGSKVPSGNLDVRLGAGGIYGSSLKVEDGSSQPQLGSSKAPNVASISESIGPEDSEVPFSNLDIRIGPRGTHGTSHSSSLKVEDGSSKPQSQLGSSKATNVANAKNAERDVNLDLSNTDRSCTDGENIKSDNLLELQTTCPSASVSQEKKPGQNSDNSVQVAAEGHCQSICNVLCDSIQPHSLKNADNSQPVLLRFNVIITLIEEKVSLELSWLDGCRESMHQVGQYLKNHFNK